MYVGKKGNMHVRYDGFSYEAEIGVFAGLFISPLLQAVELI